MIFERPDLLWIVPTAVSALALAFLLQILRRRRLTEAFGGPEAARRLMGIDLQRAPIVRFLLVTAGVVAVTVAGLGPREPDPPTVEPARPVDAVVAIDFSLSMRVDDVEPSRLERAKAVTKGILDQLPADRVGLVSFAHQAYVLAPPTEDHDVFRFFLDALEPDLLPDGDQGTRTTEALRAAGDLLERYADPDAHRIVVVVSDGESHDEEAAARSAAATLRESGVRVFTVGVGSEEGAELQRLDYRGNPAGPLLGPRGEPVVTALNTGFLEGLAEEGGGAYLGGGGPAEGPATALLDRLGREPPDRRAGPGERRGDLPFRLGLLGLVFLAAESVGEAASRRRGRDANEEGAS